MVAGSVTKNERQRPDQAQSTKDGGTCERFQSILFQTLPNKIASQLIFNLLIAVFDF